MAPTIPDHDRRTESDSLVRLHEKTDRQTVILERLEHCLYGDPTDPQAIGLRGEVAQHGVRIGHIEKNQSKFFAVLGALGLAAIGPWLGKWIGGLFKS